MEISQDSAFLLARTIKASVGGVENNDKIIGIVAVKRQKENSVKFDAQDIALFEHGTEVFVCPKKSLATT